MWIRINLTVEIIGQNLALLIDIKSFIQMICIIWMVCIKWILIFKNSCRGE